MSTRLEAVLNEGTLEERLAALRGYINAGEAKLVTARRARLELVQQARREGISWRRLQELTGVSDRFLRAEINITREDTP